MNLSDRPALVYLRGQGEASWTSHLVPESPLRMTPAGLECAVEDAWRECERQGRRGLLVLGDEVPTRAAWVQALRADAGDPLLVADLGEASLVDRVLGTLREDATARLLVTGSLDQEEPATRLAPLLLELQLVPEPDPMSSRPPRDVPHPPPNLVDVPGGRFPMGSPLTEPERWADEGPVHVVDVRPFRMARHPVTRAEFAAFLAAVTDEPLPRYWVDPRFTAPDQPVVGVGFAQATRYAGWMGLRLPSEAEWEYACRAGVEAPRYGPLDEIAWHAGNSGGRLHPVGGRRPNAFGLFDTLGNAWEWVADERHDDYEGAPADGRAWTGGVGERDVRRVLRGGSWADSPRTVRAATRLTDHPGPRIANVGLRLAADA